MENPGVTRSRAAAAFRDRNTEDRPSAQVRAAQDVLVSTLAIDEPGLLDDHVRWAAAMSVARRDPMNDSKTIFKQLRDGAERIVDIDDRQRVLRFLAGAQTPARRRAGRDDDERITDPNILIYLDKLMMRQANDSRTLAQEAASRFGDLQSIYFELLEPALIEAGDQWARAAISVSRVSHVTDMTLRVMSDLLVRQPPCVRDQRRFLALCVENEHHDVGLRMISDLLQIKGWEIVYIGADVPADECPSDVRDSAPTVVGLSVTMAAHLDQARTTIAAIHAADPGVPVVVGGLPFRHGGDLWKKIGADAGATRGPEAVATIERLAAERQGSLNV